MIIYPHIPYLTCWCESEKKCCCHVLLPSIPTPQLIIYSRNNILWLIWKALVYHEIQSVCTGSPCFSDQPSNQYSFTRNSLIYRYWIFFFLASVLFSFGDYEVVKRVVALLPPVGVGVKYGLRPSRKYSLAAPKQLFKQSNMTQRWQRREISNFDYLMFLNTIAGNRIDSRWSCLLFYLKITNDPYPCPNVLQP